jgi:hypothetical protein
MIALSLVFVGFPAGRKRTPNDPFSADILDVVDLAFQHPGPLTGRG